jgi:hypothetical protein
VNYVRNEHDHNIRPAQGPQGQLEKLRTDLLEKRQNSVEQGFVEDIHVIDKALGQVENALKEASLDQKITNSQARLGQIRTAVNEVSKPDAGHSHGATISAHEAEQIKAIKAIQGIELKPGEVFASMYGREPSNTSYMKTNIQGLFDLVALKE